MKKTAAAADGAVLAIATALLLATSAQSQSKSLNGYLLEQSNLARQSSNGNVSSLGSISRVMGSSQVGQTQVFFFNDLFTNPSNNELLSQSFAAVSVSPFPRVFTGTYSAQFTKFSQAVIFPIAVEYLELNAVDGYQPDEDAWVQVFDLRENIVNQSWSTTSTPVNWNPITTATEQYPAALNTGNSVVTVGVASSCNNINGFCFQFRFAAAPYVRNGNVYLPDAVQVDVIGNTTSFATNTGKLALLSTFLSTSDVVSFSDFHSAVDAVLMKAGNVSGEFAACSPDFVNAFNTRNTSSTYLNFARSSTLISSSSANNT
eukprot:TRINITY_DN41266_c0_g1_i6.p2 TRINITY_DN41266_c0_g1~~TRINITY_DN41266_c0_g1_i6.p2  ORF type:complete len:317 (+),score=69.94 TRINITY_DN41266_c0_g1_i6:1652-2602(+)